MLTTRFLLALARGYLARLIDQFPRSGFFFFLIYFVEGSNRSLCSTACLPGGRVERKAKITATSDGEACSKVVLKDKQVANSLGNRFACSDHRVCVRIRGGID